MSNLTIDASSGSNALQNQFPTSWANAVAGTSGSIATNSFTIDAYRVGAGSFELSRAYLFFDLSSLKPGSTITSAILRIPAVSNHRNDWNGTLYLTSHTNTDPITASTTNFNNIGNQTTYGNIANSSISESVDNDINFTSAGILALLKPSIGGVAKVALRHSNDISGSAGGIVDGQGDQANRVATSWKLIITYSPPGGGFLFNLL